MVKKLIVSLLWIMSGFFILLIMPSLALGYTTDCTPEEGGSCYQASANQSDIANAIGAAKAEDTIRISAGTANFSSTIEVTKSLYIIGAGIGSTIINDQSTFSGTWQLSGSGFVRLSGFTLTGTVGSWNGSVRIYSGNKRVDHIRFNQSNGRHPVSVWGNVSDVVIDHCTFESGGRGINVYGDTDYWTDSSQYAPGTNYGVYIEDCTFHSSGVEVVDVNYGGAYIVRYCTINNGGSLIMHGADSGERAGGWVEIYENDFVNSGSNKDMMVVIRGGTAIIYNNTARGNYNQAFKLQYWRSCYGAGSEGQPFHSSNANRCKNNSSNPLDGDYSPQNNGWPCKDQPGTGPNHDSTPVYQWNNTWDLGTAELNISQPWSCSNPSTADHVMEGRDYFNNTQKPGYTAYPYPHPLTLPNLSAPKNLRIISQ